MVAPPTTDRDNLEKKLMALIGERVLETSASFAPETDLYAAGLDSIAIMQLLLMLEEEFSVSIPVESVSRKNFQSVRAVADLLRDRLVDKTGAQPQTNGAEISTTASQSAPAAVSEPIAISTSAFEKIKNEAPKIETSREPAKPEWFASAPIRHCDYFVLSFDAMSRKTGQGGHKAHSFLVLDKLPDVARLREALREAAEFFPMLSATLHRRWLIGPPEWRPAKKNVAPDLNLYSEDGSPGALLALGAKRCADANALAGEIVNTPLPRPEADAWKKSRFSLIEMRDGGATLIFSWSHLMLDGVGAELFLQELTRIATRPNEEPVPAMPQPPAISPTLKERWETARPIVHFFRKLVAQKFDCLGPRKPTPGKTHFEIHTLTPEQTRAVNARCSQLGGGLVNMPFYLAAVMRAHDRVFTKRGLTPPAHVCSVPVQTRRKGARGPIFQNHVTMFFGALRREEIASLENAVARLTEQHAQFVKEKLGDALNELMKTMRVMPPLLYMKFISLQMRGPFASFFHSHTGEFASGLDNFLGAKVVNAFHVPGIATPPGTGIFCNEKNGRLVITLCWHENALSADERAMMLEQFLADIGAK